MTKFIVRIKIGNDVAVTSVTCDYYYVKEGLVIFRTGDKKVHAFAVAVVIEIYIAKEG